MSVCADYGFWQWILGQHGPCNCWTQRTLQDVLVAQDCAHGISGFVVFCGLPVLLCGILQKCCVIRVLLRNHSPATTPCGLPASEEARWGASGDVSASSWELPSFTRFIGCFSFKKKKKAWSFLVFNPLLETLKCSFLTDFFEGHDF